MIGFSKDSDNLTHDNSQSEEDDSNCTQWPLCKKPFHRISWVSAKFALSSQLLRIVVSQVDEVQNVSYNMKES